jgi:hypothetical protein
LAAANEDVAICQQGGSVRGPCAIHVAGANPSVRFGVEQLTPGSGDPVDIGPTGDQYPAIFQKGRGVPDVAVE